MINSISTCDEECGNGSPKGSSLIRTRSTRIVEEEPTFEIAEVKKPEVSILENHPEEIPELRQNSKNPNLMLNSAEIKVQNKEGNALFNYFKKKTGTLSKRQGIILGIFAFVDLLAATVISIQAPFYPEVAGNKGASAFQHGLVFGIFELTSIIAAPIFGAKMSVLGPRKVFIAGILTTGLSSIIFGLLHTIKDSNAFIQSCLVVRVCEAIASFTIIAIEFTENVAFTFAILETFYGIGMIIGPLVGGILFQLGGYTLPFATMGGLLFLSALVSCFILPNDKDEKNPGQNKNNDQEEIIGKTGGLAMLNLIRIPSVVVTSYGIVATAIGVGFLCALLEPHLRNFELSKIAVGAVFILSGGVYAISAPLWGHISDNKKVNPKLILLIGTLFSLSGFILIGPLPFIPGPTILWVTCVGLTLFGVGMGAVYVSGFIIFLNDAIEQGYPDNVSTYGLVSGLWTCMVSLGYCIGPVAAGLFADSVGFRYGSLFVLGAQAILILLLVPYFIKIKCQSIKQKIQDSV